MLLATGDSCALAAGGQPADRLRPIPRKISGTPATLSMDLSAGVPIVEARLGDTSLRMVIDTGAGWSVLTPEAARRAGLEVREAEGMTARDAAGNARAVEIAHVERLLLPATDGDAAVELASFDLVIMDAPVLARAGAEGILGVPILRRMVTRFDFAAGRLELGALAPPKPDGREVMELRAARGGLLGIDARFAAPDDADDAGEAAPATQPAEEAEQLLLIDTGLSSALHLPQATVEALGTIAPPQSGGRSATALEERGFDTATLARDLHIGRYRVVRPTTSLFRRDPAAENGGAGAAAEGAGAIGTGLLREFIVTIDLPRRRIRFERDGEVIELAGRGGEGGAGGGPVRASGSPRQ